jgi:hypothetical protein
MNRRSLFKRLAGCLVAAKVAPVVLDSMDFEWGPGLPQATFHWWRNSGSVASGAAGDTLRARMRAMYNEAGTGTLQTEWLLIDDDEDDDDV